MPQRFLRPGIRNSARYNAVSMHAQSLWLRLVTLVDDFGRYDGRPSVLCGECFSVWNELHPDDVINTQRTAALSKELDDAKLAEFYESEGKFVVQLTQWLERTRTDKSKWPDRGSIPQRNPAESCGILRTEELVLSNNGTNTHNSLSLQTPQESAGKRSGILPPSPSPSPSIIVPSPSPPHPPPNGVEGSMNKTQRLPAKFQTVRMQKEWSEWQEIRKGMKKVKNMDRLFDRQLEFLARYSEPVAYEILSTSIRNGWQGLFEPKPNQRNGHLPPPQTSGNF